MDCATVSNGEIGYCTCNTCTENEGDCDFHEDCQGGHVCGFNSCPASLGFDSEVDCCSPMGNIRKLCVKNIIKILLIKETFVNKNLFFRLPICSKIIFAKCCKGATIQI